MAIAQLQTLTSYSLLASTNRIDDLILKAKEYGYDALAITDKNVLYGVAEFYQKCKKNDIHPIIGLTIEYQRSIEQTATYPLILLAKNQSGYENLIKISTMKMELSHQESFLFDDFKFLLHDLVVICPDKQSEITRLFENQELDEIEEIVKQMEQVIDKDSLYIGISITEVDGINSKWIDYLRQQKREMVALQDVRYLYPSDDFALKVLKNIDEGTKLSEDSIKQTGPYYLNTTEMMEEKFARYELEEAVENTRVIAKKCQFVMEFNQTLLPHFDVPKGESASSYLKNLCLDNLPKRVNHVTKVYEDRLQMELDVIHEMGFDDYFLIIWDVMNFAANNKIVTGAGRGSAAGSLVAYVLKITDVDPIQYHLLFERFLNKERFTMPDIDLDLPDNRREEVLLYVNEKYGHHHVAQIATFGTMAAKMALRDVSRVFSLSQSEANQWSNAVPNVLKITLKEAYEQSRKLQKLVEESERNKLIFDVAVQIEGLPRHVSTHAAGVVISDKDLTHYVPLQEGANGMPLTQFTMGDVEAIGLLKMDFLGLRNLSILDNTLRYIRRTYHEDIQLNEIPMDDEKTLKLFRNGQTTGIFQFESRGIRNVLVKLGPSSIEDIAAVNALYRPGPMDNIDLFIQRKKGLAPIEYPHDSLKGILDVTYGVIVYQEQIMQVASKMAGFSLGQADILRRAISKKKKEVLDEERRHFVDGSVAQGYTKEVANEVYDYIERFANYGFNRSHAMAYSFIAYQMAYLKVHYPEPFFASLLDSVSHNLNKIKEYIAEARKFGVKIKGPDINQSGYSFNLNKNQILFGFSSLKGIRRDFVQNILNVRKAEGPFKSLDNFLLRVDNKWLKVENILPLIYIGAFDSIHGNRKQLVIDLEAMIKNIVYSGGSMDLLSILSLKKEVVTDYTLEEKLEQEEYYLGTYLSGHPIDEFRVLKIVKGAKSLDQLIIDKRTTVLAYIKEIRLIRTKKGEQMAFLDGNDTTGEISVTIFPKMYRQIGRELEKNKVYLIEGKVVESTYNQEIQILADTLVLADKFKDKIGNKICYVKIMKDLGNNEILEKVKEILKKHHGNNAVILYNEESAQKIALSDEFWVNGSIEMQNELSCILGKENVILQ